MIPNATRGLHYICDFRTANKIGKVWYFVCVAKERLLPTLWNKRLKVLSCLCNENKIR